MTSDECNLATIRATIAAMPKAQRDSVELTALKIKARMEESLTYGTAVCLVMAEMFAGDSRAKAGPEWEGMN